MKTNLLLAAVASAALITSIALAQGTANGPVTHSTRSDGCVACHRRDPPPLWSVCVRPSLSVGRCATMIAYRYNINEGTSKPSVHES